MADHRIRRVVSLLALVVVSCESNGGDPSYARAFDNRPDTAARAHDGDRMKQLRERAEQDAARDREAQIETLTSVITPLPADVKSACADAGAAFDAYARKRLEGEALARWDATKGPDVDRFVAECEATHQVAVGACMSHALNEASPATFGPEASSELAERCRTRWARADVTAIAHPK